MYSLAKIYIKQYAVSTIGNPEAENKFLNVQASANCATGRRYYYFDRSRNLPKRRE